MTTIYRPYVAALAVVNLLLAVRYVWRFARIPRAQRTPAQQRVLKTMSIGLVLMVGGWLLAVPLMFVSHVPWAIIIVTITLVLVGIVGGTIMMARGADQVTVLEFEVSRSPRTRAERRQRARHDGEGAA